MSCIRGKAIHGIKILKFLLDVDTHRCTGLFSHQNTSRFYFDNGTQVYTGRVEVCIDGVSLPVCADGLNTTNESYPSQQTLDNVCVFLYGSGEFID